MSKNMKLVAGMLLAALAVVVYMALNTEAPTSPGKRVHGKALVGMPAYSIGLAKLGSVSRIVSNVEGKVVTVQIESHGMLTRGTREVPANQAWVSGQYLQVNMHRHEFRALPRIDIKKR